MLLSPILLCVTPLTQTLQMPLLYGILTVTDILQSIHLLTSHFFLYKFPIVLSPQIDWHGLQWGSFLSNSLDSGVTLSLTLPCVSQLTQTL